MLLERDAALDAVRTAYRRVRASGRGEFVLVGGEAGIGKTSLLRQVADEVGTEAVVLWGSCDNLSTPRPLGPLSDIALRVGGELEDLLVSGARRDRVFAATLRLLSASGPTVAVVEDAHWADEATIDLLTYLRRRVDRTRALVLVSYRDDEISSSHPLRFVLGDSTVRDTRLRLAPLSVDAVATLAVGKEVDLAAVHRVTGGNPFFVTEMLAAGGAVAPSVRDAVLARTATLDLVARGVLEAVAVVPLRVELWLLEQLVDDPEDLGAIDRCVEHGVLRAEGGGVVYRHELARLAVLDSLAPVRRRELHRRALVALGNPPHATVDEARAAHHAVEAGDADAVVVHAPAAAEHAARVGAHREAADHLDHALRHAGRLPIGEQIDLWQRLANERQLLAHLAEAVAAFRRAIELARAAGERHREGELLSRLGGVLTTAGRQREALQVGEEALAILEPLKASPALALAYANRCAQHMLARELRSAEEWGQRAMRLSEQLGRRDHLCYTMIQSGIALLMGGVDSGHDRIRQGMQIAGEEGFDSWVALGYSQIGSGCGEVRRYDLALPALEAGAAFSVERELLASELYIKAWLARCHLDQGRWSEAGELCHSVLGHPRCVGISRMVAVNVLGRLRSRRGDPGVWAALDESLELARDNGHLQRLWPTAAARAEAAWLEGHLESEVDVLREAYELASTVQYPWALGELSWWLWLAGAGHAQRPTGAAAEPYRLSFDGRHREAAEVWTAIGCPFEAGVAAMASKAEEDVRWALAAFKRLGARPAERLAANRLRELGGRVPRGPNAATRGNPAGLTGREAEVLALLAEGLRNSEIASRLVITAKTVDHHVSSLLAKLGVSSRQAAAAHAVRLGLVPHLGASSPKDGESHR